MNGAYYCFLGRKQLTMERQFLFQEVQLDEIEFTLDFILNRYNFLRLEKASIKSFSFITRPLLCIEILQILNPKVEVIT